MLEWTGERCVPWSPDVQVIYEHYHRYAWAAQVVAGKRILDLASGEGYGAAILARTAAEVIGLELDEEVVAHATRAYPSVSFLTGSMTDARGAVSGSFDVVTCFEALEHIHEHDQLLAQVASLLAPEGMFLVSSPDKDVYSDEHHDANPFHVRELNETELLALLRSQFPHVRLFRQQIAVGSCIYSTAQADPARIRGIERAGDGWTLSPAPPATYLLAAASAVPLPGALTSDVLLDGGLTVVRDPQREVYQLREKLNRTMEELRQARQPLPVRWARRLRHRQRRLRGEP